MTQKFNEQMAALYQDAVENLRFLKQQQWSVTNYAVLIYAAAIFLFTQDFLPKDNGKFILLAIVIATCVVNIIVVWLLQYSMRRCRDRITWVHTTQFTAGERRTLQLVSRDRWFDPMIEFWLDRIIAILLTLATLAGAVVTVVVLTG